MTMIPKIRFSEFVEEWKEMDFSEIFSFIKNNSLSRDQLAREGLIKNIHYGDVLIKYGECIDANKDEIPFVKDSELGKKLLRVGAIQNGDVIIADAAEDNTVGKCSEIIAQDSDLIISGLHTIAIRPNIEFANRYLGYYMNSCAYHNQLLPHIQGTKISSISKKAVCSTNIKAPTLSEQRRISHFFTLLDETIRLEGERLSSLKQVKAASLQSFFPQEGEKEPRVRFKGFSGEWKKVKIGEIFKERNEQNIHGEMLSVTMNNGIIKASENGRFDNSNDDKSHYKVVKIGDIAYNSMRMWQGASGCSAYEGIVSPAYTVLNPQEGIDSLFFSYLFKCQNMLKVFRFNSQGLTSDTWNLKYPTLSQIEIQYPESLAEQRALSTYFTNIDEQIRLVSEKIEKMKKVKGACLEGMMV